MITSNIHSNFKLNGNGYDIKSLVAFAENYTQNGKDFEKIIGNFLLEWFDDNEYVILKTSGTTGTPKAIKTPKQFLVNSALATAFFFDLKPGITILHCLPCQYIAGKMMIVRAIVSGFEMDIIEPSSNPLQNISTYYDFAAMVPLQVNNSISKLHLIDKIIVGGAKISDDLCQKLIAMPTKIYETYGMTETVTHIAAKKIGEKYFSLLPNISISKDDRNCLIIEAPLLSKSKIVTNDIVEIFDQNQFIHLGRLDNVINSGGVKLNAEQIEAKLQSVIDLPFFVAGLPDADLGEKLVLIIEGKKTAINTAVFEVLEKYERPKECFFVPKFVFTESGKIRRKETLNL